MQFQEVDGLGKIWLGQRNFAYGVVVLEKSNVAGGQYRHTHQNQDASAHA